MNFVSAFLVLPFLGPFWGFTPAYSAIEVIAEAGHSPSCEEFRISRELRIYKDPSLFMGSLSLIYQDPVVGWEKLMGENPLLTTLRGTAQLLRLGPPTEFKNFGFIAKLYESVEPKLRLQEIIPRAIEMKHGPSVKIKPERAKKYSAAQIVPVMLCGDSDAYRNTMGFVLQSDLTASQLDANGGNILPPSVHSIPEWKSRP